MFVVYSRQKGVMDSKLYLGFTEFIKTAVTKLNGPNIQSLLTFKSCEITGNIGIPVYLFFLNIRKIL